MIEVTLIFGHRSMSNVQELKIVTPRMVLDPQTTDLVVVSYNYNFYRPKHIHRHYAHIIYSDLSQMI